MKKEEFYFDSRDGESQIHAVRWTPDTDAPVGVFQIIHGMQEYVERYEDLAEFLTGKGWVVTGEDHLGHGKSVPEGGTMGYFCDRDPATVVVRDVHRLKKMTQELYPDLPYVIMGHSMGSFIMRNYLFRYGTGIQASIIMGTGQTPMGLVRVSKCVAAVQRFFLGAKHPAKMMTKMGFGTYNDRTEKRTEYDWLSRNRENVDRYIADPLCGGIFPVNGFQTLFELLDRQLDKDNLAKVPKSLPVFFVAGEEDPVGNYGAGVRAAMKDLQDAGLTDVTLKLYPGDRHEILNEDDRDQVKEDIYEWIMSKV